MADRPQSDICKYTTQYSFRDIRCFVQYLTAQSGLTQHLQRLLTALESVNIYYSPNNISPKIQPSDHISTPLVYLKERIHPLSIFNLKHDSLIFVRVDWDIFPFPLKLKHLLAGMYCSNGLTVRQ